MVCSSSFHQFIHDYQSNNRLIMVSNDTAPQTNHYYPTGALMAKSTSQGLQPFKYNGKEFDNIHALNWYDYGARWYDPAMYLFTSRDPMCEKYYHISPYAYCGGNPVNAIDFNGCDTLNISYANNKWNLSAPIMAEGDDIFNVTVGGKTSTYTFFEKEYGERVNMLNLDNNKSSYTLGIYHVSGAKEEGTGFYVTPGGLSSTIDDSGLRIPEGVYSLTAPRGSEKWRKPGVGGDVSARGIRFHYAGTSDARVWTRGCFILSSSYSKKGNNILFDPNESINASRAFDKLLGGTTHYFYYINGKQREGTLFPNKISKFLILKSVY